MENREYDNFDEFATDYRTIHTNSLKVVGGDSELYSRLKAKQIVEILANSNGGKLLDFGCGDGIIVEMLSPLLPNWEFTGVDVSEESIRVAKEKGIERSKWVTFDGFKLPFEDNSFEVIFVANVFHHIEHKNHQGLIAEFIRILKKGGRVFFFEHNPYNPVTRHIVNTCPFDEDAVLLPPAYAKSLYRNGGFGTVNLNYVLFFPRHKLFSLFWPLENVLKWLPLGGQYFITATKD